MQRKEFLETEQQKEDKSRSILNILAAFTSDPLEKLRRRRVRVAAQLAALIATLGLTHAKVAAKSGIKPSQLSRQLSGDTNLTLDTISRICDALGADFDVVFRKTGQAPAKQWWEHDKRSVEHFSSVILEFSQSKREESSPKLASRSKVAFSMHMSEMIGCAGQVPYTSNQAENDDSKLIAA